MAFRPQDTNILDTINVNSDTWQIAIDKVNWIVDHLRNTVVTASNTGDYVGNTSGNGFITGIFGANTLVCTNIRGGNVMASNTLTVNSALIVSNNLVVSGNATVNGTLSSFRNINANGNLAVVNTLTVGANASVNGDLVVTGSAGVTAPRVNMGDFVTLYSANSNLGANTTSPQTFFSFAKADFSTGKVLLQSKIGVNTQVYEAVFSHSGSSPSISVYGVVSSPSNANNGLLSASANTTHILLAYRQSTQNTAIKASISLIR